MKKKLALFLFICLAFLAGCGEEEIEPECFTAADCPVEKCFEYNCVNNMCQENMVTDCCGNDICEEEHGQNYCNCPDDCPQDTCEGKIVTGEDWRGNDVTTEYLQKMCIDDRCVLDFDRSRQSTISEMFEIEQRNLFEVSVENRYKDPFDVKNDEFTMRFIVDDIGDDLVFPIEIRRIRLFVDGSLFKETSPDGVLEELDDEYTISLKMENEPRTIEEESDIEIQVNYQYTEWDSRDEENVTTRNDASNRFRGVTLVVPSDKVD